MYGMTADEAKRFLEADLRRQIGTTSFYWENPESEELLDLLMDLIPRLIAANNKKVQDDMNRALSRAR
jgi:hypothetical protein